MVETPHRPSEDMRCLETVEKHMTAVIVRMHHGYTCVVFCSRKRICDVLSTLFFPYIPRLVPAVLIVDFDRSW